MTLPEVLLWKILKPSSNKQFDIRRQHPVLGRYVVDFFHADTQIAFKIDGKYVHALRTEQDNLRQQEIEATGVAFVRIPASWVLKNPSEVADFILLLCSGELKVDDIDELLH